MYHSPFHLDMCLLLTNNSHSMDVLHHLPPLPLIIDYSDRTMTLARKDEDNIQLGPTLPLPFPTDPLGSSITNCETMDRLFRRAFGLLRPPGMASITPMCR
jgi:hypothetical protein